MAHTVLILRLMVIITWTTICASAPQLVGLTFPGSSVSEAVLGKPCHTAFFKGFCVKREQCGSAIASVGFNQSNPCGPTAGKDVICCGKTTRTADVLDVSLPDVINPEVNEEIGRCPPCGNKRKLGLKLWKGMTEEECKDKMEEKSRYSGRVTRDVSWYSSWYPRSIPDSGRSESRTVPSQTVAHNNSEDPVPNIMEYEDRLPPLPPHIVRIIPAMWKIGTSSCERTFFPQNGSRNISTPTTLVNGGFEPGVATWPWMALLGKQRPGTTPDWQCTGTLIRYGKAHKWIITAAHCFNDGALDIVRLGEHDHTDGSDETITSDHWVEKRVVHPEYSVHTGYHDMALLKLSRYPMDKNQGNMNLNVAPICLPWGEKISENVVGEQAYVVGWGATEYSGSFSPILQEGHMTIFNSSICDEKYKKGDITEGNYEKRYPDGIEKHLLCAGHPEGGVDACKGDSGGPLMIKSPNPTPTPVASHWSGIATPVASHLYYLTGVVSHGPGCGLKEYPGLYAPLHNPAYLAWIKKVAFNPEEPDGCDRFF